VALKEPLAATRNACKLCAPLGACLALRGVAGAAPFLHGSQGCATYIRRYLIRIFANRSISRFPVSARRPRCWRRRQPAQRLNNVARQYHPELIGMRRPVCRRLSAKTSDCCCGIPARRDAAFRLVHVATAELSRNARGWLSRHRARIGGAVGGRRRGCAGINVFPACVAGRLALSERGVRRFRIEATLLPDYSETLDGPQLDEYQKIPAGGTPVGSVRAMGRARLSLELGRTLAESGTAGRISREQIWRGTPQARLAAWSAGKRSFFAALSELSGRPVPEKHVKERGRLVDSYVDAHKYVFGRRAVVYGEEDLVVGLASFLSEIGVQPVLCASGGRSGRLKRP